METRFAKIVGESSVEIASITDSTLTETKVFRSDENGQPTMYCIIKCGLQSESYEWCRSSNALYFRLAKRLGSGDFALLSYRLLGKVR